MKTGVMQSEARKIPGPERVFLMAYRVSTALSTP